jgi:hypothetical protein
VVIFPLLMILSCFIVGRLVFFPFLLPFELLIDNNSLYHLFLLIGSGRALLGRGGLSRGRIALAWCCGLAAYLIQAGGEKSSVQYELLDMQQPREQSVQSGCN